MSKGGDLILGSEGGDFAKKIDEHHLVDRASSRGRYPRVGNHHRKALGAGDRHVDAVAVEDERETARSVFAVARTERKDADGGLLSLELVHAANAGALGKRRSVLRNIRICASVVFRSIALRNPPGVRRQSRHVRCRPVHGRQKSLEIGNRLLDPM